MRVILQLFAMSKPAIQNYFHKYALVWTADFSLSYSHEAKAIHWPFKICLIVVEILRVTKSPKGQRAQNVLEITLAWSQFCLQLSPTGIPCQLQESCSLRRCISAVRCEVATCTFQKVLCTRVYTHRPGISPAMLYSSWEVVSFWGHRGHKRKLAEVEAEPWRAGWWLTRLWLVGQEEEQPVCIYAAVWVWRNLHGRQLYTLLGKEIQQRVVYMFTMLFEVFLITALSRLKMMFKFWALPIWVFGNGKRWVLKGCISIFHIPYLEVIHIVVQQTIYESYECFMLIWGDIPLVKYIWNIHASSYSSGKQTSGTHPAPLLSTTSLLSSQTSKPSFNTYHHQQTGSGGEGAGGVVSGQARDWGSGGQRQDHLHCRQPAVWCWKKLVHILGLGLIPSTVKHKE